MRNSHFFFSVFYLLFPAVHQAVIFSIDKVFGLV